MIEQGTDNWHRLRLGVITASKAGDVLAKKGSQTRQNYLHQLVAEVCTSNYENITSNSLEWGNENEAAAISAYEFLTGYKVLPGEFIYKDKGKRCGCSPDGLVSVEAISEDDDAFAGKKINFIEKGLELKCPYSTKTYIDFIYSNKIKKEYTMQCQFSMWVTGYDEWDFANYDPRMITKMIHIVTLERDKELMKRFDEAIPEFIEDMDKILKDIGVEYGRQWD